MNKFLIYCLFFVACPTLVFASGFGVFTQGASGLGQGNAVVAHPTGPSSIYFNPALINDVPGRQVEIGTTGVYADRKVSLSSGGSTSTKDGFNYPSSAYYTHQIDNNLSAGIGVFFPFGLSTEWDGSYEGRYLGTYGDIATLDINPAVSYRVTRDFTLAGGLSLLYMDATLKKHINQTAAYMITDAALGGGVLPALGAPLGDIDQQFEGHGWGYGFNLGALYKATEQLSIGLTYRSHIDVKVKGDASFNNVTPLLQGAFVGTSGAAKVRLPAQAAVGIAYQFTDRFVCEVGARWEDWSSTDELRIDLDSPVFGQTSDSVPRDWKATWAYNIGGQYRLDDQFTVNVGYLFGDSAVPGSTFEPLVPDTDAHLFTFGTDFTSGPWTISGAFGFEYHVTHVKNNNLADPLGSAVAGVPTDTANGSYDSKIYLSGSPLRSS